MTALPTAPRSALTVCVDRALPGYSLNIEFESVGGVTALLGPSGAGKTLTLRAIAGLLRPDSGRITLNGRVLFDSLTHTNVPARDRQVGYVFQHYALFPHLSVAENIAYGLHTRSRPERANRVQQMLELVGLHELARRTPHELSGGQQQRVALARSLAPEPSLLLLDEPLAALDAPLRTRLGAELRSLHERTGIPMVLVTHDPDEAARLADTVLYVRGGRVTDAAV